MTVKKKKKKSAYDLKQVKRWRHLQRLRGAWRHLEVTNLHLQSLRSLQSFVYFLELILKRQSWSGLDLNELEPLFSVVVEMEMML